MDKKRGILNVGVAVGFKVILLIGSLLARRFLLQYLGTEINGLNSLYISIIGFLGVAELGIGSAIIFSLYKPIVNGDKEKIIALYRLIEKLYRIVGAVILAAGLIVMMFLPALAKGYSIPVTEMRIAFVLMLISVVVTYAYSAKVALLEAYKNNYVSTVYYSVAMIVQYALQIGCAVAFRSFYAFLICRTVASLIQWIALEIHTRKHYPEIIKGRATVDKDTSKEVTKNIGAMFMHKTGHLLINSTDSVIISAFISVVMLGYYSNYVTIVTSMTAFLMLFFTPLTSIIGHKFAKEPEELGRYFNFFHDFNFVLGTLFFLGYYAIIKNLIVIFFGAGLTLSNAIALIITYNYFIQFMRNAVVLFRDATGTFYYDRWNSIIEGIANVILSIVFVLIFPEEFKVVGVLAATILTSIFVSHIVEPFVLYKHALMKPVRFYYAKNYAFIVAFGGLLYLMDFLKVRIESEIAELFVNGFISVGISLAVLAIMLAVDKDFRFYTVKLLKKGKESL